MELCVRCQDPATAALTFSYHERVVTLNRLDGSVRPLETFGLCTVHALTKTVPVGWVLRDELGSNLPLFTVEEVGDGA